MVWGLSPVMMRARYRTSGISSAGRKARRSTAVRAPLILKSATHTGEKPCVPDFKIKGALTAVDLRNPRQLVSPFLLADAAAIGQLRADIPFLERLGDELTRPVLTRGAAIDYVPSQYLCEFIKKRGYDGVVYRSSVSDGINLALFDPSRAVAGAVDIYDVRGVSVQIERVYGRGALVSGV